MPSFSSILKLSDAATGSNVVLADIDRIKGAFKSYASASTMNSTSVNYFSNGQIVYAQDSGSLFKATVTPADPPNSFVDSVTFSKATHGPDRPEELIVVQPFETLVMDVTTKPTVSKLRGAARVWPRRARRGRRGHGRAGGIGAKLRPWSVATRSPEPPVAARNAESAFV